MSYKRSCEISPPCKLLFTCILIGFLFLPTLVKIYTKFYLLKLLRNVFVAWCVFVRASLHMRREEKPTRCHCMLYCTYDILNMFRILLFPSSRALDYLCVFAAYYVSCLAAGCRGSDAGQQGVRPGRGMLHDCVVDVTVCFIAFMIRSNVSSTSMPIIRSSRLTYICYFRLWCAVLGRWLSGVKCGAAGCASR